MIYQELLRWIRPRSFGGAWPDHAPQPSAQRAYHAIASTIPIGQCHQHCRSAENGLNTHNLAHEVPLGPANLMYLHPPQHIHDRPHCLLIPFVHKVWVWVNWRVGMNVFDEVVHGLFVMVDALDSEFNLRKRRYD